MSDATFAEVGEARANKRVDTRDRIVRVAAALFTDFSLLPPGQRNVLRMSMGLGDAACASPAGEEHEPVRKAARRGG